MPRNGTKATPKDLLTELARRKDGVTPVRAYISGIAEPVTAFRVSADGCLKTRMEEWKTPKCYTSGLRNLLQRHFKKVTAGEWFASGAVLVQTQVANSVERTWGRGTRQPHPKWDNVTWEEVHVPSDEEIRPLSLLSLSLSLQPPEEEASNTHENLPEANAHHGEALAPTDQSTLPQSQSEPAPAQNQMAMHPNMPFAQLPPVYPNEDTPTIIPLNQLPARSSHGVAQAPPTGALAPAQNQMAMHQQVQFESEQERADARATLASMGFPRNARTEALLRKHCNNLDAIIAELAQAAVSGASMDARGAQLAPAPLNQLPARSSHAAVGLSHAAVTPSPSTPASHAFSPAPPGRRQASSHRPGLLRDSSQANTRFDLHKGGGMGLGKAASAAGGMYSASTAAVPAAPVTYSPAGAAQGSLAGAVHRPVGDFANLASGFEISERASAASGQSGSEALSGRKRCHSTMAGPHAQDGAAADCGEKADRRVASFSQASTQSMLDQLQLRPENNALRQENEILLRKRREEEAQCALSTFD